MAQMSRRFNFDDFDELCREALDDRMAVEGAELEEQERWADHDRVFYPGEVGGVLVHLTFAETPDNLPPEAA